jgi:CHAT domain-containing protein
MARGVEALEHGGLAEAVASFTEAADLYAKLGETGPQQKALLRLSDAQQAIGEYRDAARSLQTALALAEPTGDRAQVASILGSLGNVYIAIGPPAEAERYLRRSVSLAKEVNAARLAAASLNNLGNHYNSQKQYGEALRTYRESALLAKRGGSASLQARALANAARVSLEMGDAAGARELADTACQRVQALEPSHDKAYLLINLGRTHGRLGTLDSANRAASRVRSFEILREAEAVAAAVGDPRASSFALGYMGALYEEERRLGDALELTRRAIFQAQQVAFPESLYLWHWQAGRLLEGLAKREEAIASYSQAVEILEGLRYQLPVAYQASGQSFEEAVGPVYFELVDLLLRLAAESEEPERVQRLLVRARDTVELLKKAELRDYFRDECVDALEATTRRAEEVSSRAAVVYPILLPDRTELLVSFGEAGIKRYAVPVGREEMTAEIQRFRALLEKRTTNQYRRHGQKLYDWLIRPYEPELARRNVETLVFVPGGVLRTIPMSALQDGRRFLIEKYAVAVTPGVELTDPRPLDRSKIKLFLSGLSESVEGFPALAHVPMELESVQSIHGGEILLDESFRLNAVRETLRDEQFSVVHIATHGEFAADFEETYLLAYDGRLTMDRLGEYVGLFKFRENPLELLTLSACETAQGDGRAALGLSGVAIQAGARSAVGTLWVVNDEAAARLVIEFYRQLEDESVSRALALQRAQLELLGTPAYDHPGYWSPFLLISSWL